VRTSHKPGCRRHRDVGRG